MTGGVAGCQAASLHYDQPMLDWRRGRLAAAALAALLALGPVSGTSAQSAAAATDRYDLAAAEHLGGHTLARHVGRTDADLRARLTREPGISAASTYTDRATAERVIAATLARFGRRVDGWAARTGSRPNLALDYTGPDGTPIGRTLRRGDTRTIACTDAVVVLRWHASGRYFVLTSYPELRR